MEKFWIFLREENFLFGGECLQFFHEFDRLNICNESGAKRLFWKEYNSFQIQIVQKWCINSKIWKISLEICTRTRAEMLASARSLTSLLQHQTIAVRQPNIYYLLHQTRQLIGSLYYRPFSKHNSFFPTWFNNADHTVSSHKRSIFCYLFIAFSAHGWRVRNILHIAIDLIWSYYWIVYVDLVSIVDYCVQILV